MEVEDEVTARRGHPGFGVPLENVSPPEETYPKTQSRADMLGEQCEYKMAALIYLRALFASSEFHLASNMDGTGAFDDLVFKIHYTEEGIMDTRCITCFVQLKHKKKVDSKITEAMLLTTNTKKNDFSMLKYFESYCTITEALLEGNADNPILNSDLDDCFFVLFTNAAIPHKSAATFSEVNSFINTILNTGADDRCVFSFSEKDQSIWQPDQEKVKKYPGLQTIVDNLDRYHTFLKKFIICDRQANVAQLDMIIKSEIALRCGTSEEDITKIFSLLNEKFQDWWQNHDVFITEHSLCWYESVQVKLDDLNAPVLFPLHKLHVHFTGEHLQVMYERLCCSAGFTSVVIKDIDTSVRCLKLYEMLKRHYSGGFLMLRVSDALLRLQEVLAAWRHKLSKVICIDSEDCLEKTVTLLRELNAAQVNHPPKLILVSGNKVEHFTTVIQCICPCDQYTDDWTIEQFDDVSQCHIFSQKLLFQGNEITLENFISGDKNLKTLVCGRLLSDVLCDTETMYINGEGNDEVDSYIPRSLSHSVFIDQDIFKDRSTENVLVVSAITEEDLQKLTRNSDSFSENDLGVLDDSQLYVALDSLIIPDVEMRYMSDEDKFSNIIEKHSEKNVHWFKKHNNNFVWLKSKGSSDIVLRYVKKSYSNCKFDGNTECMHDDDFILSNSEKCMLVIGEPGMGKSVLLTHLAEKEKRRNSSSWVLHIYLNALSNVLDEANTWTLESLHSSLCNVVTSQSSASCAPLIKEMLKNALFHRGNLIVLLDAFDEISPAFTQSTLKMVKLFLDSTKICKLITSSRPISQRELEEYLSCNTFIIHPFTEGNQFDFLLSFWKSQLPDSSADNRRKKLEGFVKIVLELTESIPFTFQGRSFAAVPLHLMMLAVVYSPQMDSFLQTGSYGVIPELLSLAHLYESFISIKRDIYYKKFPVDLKRSKNTGLKEREDTYFIDQHMMCALVVKLSAEELTLLHDQTITEKATAFLNKLSLEKTGVIQGEVRGRPCFVHFTYCEYLTALWFIQNYKENRKAIAQLFFETKFEFVRYLFDLLLASGSQLHESIPCGNDRMFAVSLPSYEPNSKDKGGRTGLHLTASYKNVRFTSTMLRWGCDFNIEDDVLLWNAARYGEAVGAWRIVELFLQSGFNPKDLIVVKSNMDNETFILNNLGDIVKFNCVHLVKIFLNGVFDVNRAAFIDSNRENSTVLHIAVKYGHLDLVKYLVEEANADVTISDAKGCTPLHYAALNNHLDMAVFLIDTGSNVDYRDVLGMSALHKAAYVGGVDIVNVLSDSGADIKMGSYEGVTPLHLAAEKGHVKVVSLLLDRGADVNKVTRSGSSPLHSAMVSGNVEVVDLLLNKGASVNMEMNNGATPLIGAIKLGHKNVATRLVEKLTDNHNDVQDGLYLAAQLGLVNKALVMIENGANVNHKDPKTGYTPLHAAMLGHSLDMINFLVDRGAEINSEAYNGATPLHLAVEYALVCPQHLDKSFKVKAVDKSTSETLNVLLDSGAYIILITPKMINLSTGNIYVEDAGNKANVSFVSDKTLAQHDDSIPQNSENTWVPAVKGHIIQSTEIESYLYAFMCDRRVSMINQLLDRGADMDKVTSKLADAFHLAAGKGNCCILTAFSKRGYDVNKPVAGRNGFTPLHCVMFSASTDATNLLLDMGADINALSQCGISPLHLAVQENKVNLASVLLRRGANVNIPAIPRACMTTLHLASETGNVQMFQLLVENGADINSVTEYTWTPLHIVAGFGYLEITRYLVQKGANVNVTDRCGMTPLHIAAEGGHSPVIHFLLDNGSNIESKNISCSTPLTIAVRDNKLDAVVALLDRGADINCKARLSSTPLHFAVAKGYDSISEYLLEKGADCTLSDDEGNSVVHLAIIFQRETLLQRLLECKCEVNGRDSLGCTPLHLAARWNRRSMIDTLVHSGANVNIINASGLTPLGVAYVENHLEASLQLKNHGTVIICRPRCPKGQCSGLPFPTFTPQQLQAWLSVPFIGNDVI